jgi:nanoRNase/pAp phosphatase (c-di-AMP/oligoRNAs hydrolase)
VGRQRQNTVLAVGRSIFDRTSSADIGAVMLGHGGGGHPAAGTCQVPHEDAERVLAQVLDSVASPLLRAA